ncbi:MAG: LysR family transcriptional regulator [Nitrosomonadales bacterium]|nr:LysR family transcriptional regulator [Nitrosomonadales bacterium]MBT4183321.1 LysR family transcriptional regulator [Nitrosomonadales bacterium]MBT6818468.1 LysR family transcriptional regulator [Nitrosomonadales bacterium]MBT7482670.1 LysR family transcriptional regulator [Nitrosomonadales bacterium]
MTLSELRFVVSVAHEKNFRRAAIKSFVSQPALSLAIKKIETELGVLIFERNRMGASLTTVGEQIVNQAKKVLEEAGKIKEISALETNTKQTAIKIGIIYSIAPYLLPSIIPLLKKISPDIILKAEEDVTKNLIHKLKDGVIDAAIIALPFDIPGIALQDLYDEPFKVLIPRKHKWNSKKKINTKDLVNEKILLLDNTHCFSMQVRDACPGISNNAEVQAGTSLETIRNMVASNLGISILPQSATAKNYKNDAINILSFESPIPFRRVALAYRQGTSKKDSLDIMVEAISSIKDQIIGS